MLIQQVHLQSRLEPARLNPQSESGMRKQEEQKSFNKDGAQTGNSWSIKGEVFPVSRLTRQRIRSVEIGLEHDTGTDN